MASIVHTLSRADWQSFRETGEHRPDSLATEGFVHCSKPGQIVIVADINHATDDDMMLLVLDESNLDSPVRYESGDDGSSAFPHVYGPLSLDSVVDSFRFEQDETGYRLPDELLRY
jgi:uncharacterized protein (DUF952 family)